MRKLLIIGYDFHGYNRRLSEVIGNDFDVDFIEHQQIFNYVYYPKLTRFIYAFLSKMLRITSIKKKLYSIVVFFFSDNFLDYILMNLPRNQYDTVLVISTREFSSNSLEKLQGIVNANQWILYKWDAESRFQMSHLHSMFDKVYSFQHSDATQGVRYLPNYHFIEPGVEHMKNLDLVAVSIFGADRYDQYMNFLKTHPTDLHFSRFVSTNIERSSNPYVVNSKIAHEVVLEKYKQSRFVFDFNPRGQTGMSQRVLEALACGCFVITENKDALKNFSDTGLVINTSSFINYKYTKASHKSNSLILDSYYKNWINIVTS